jgi:diacylglycerol kinase family enzyme
VAAGKTRFIVNPRSGRAARVLDRVKTCAAEMQAGVVLTTRPRHAAELTAAALADGCELIVAVGGDGTLNEIAAGLVGTPAVFGLVPCGSGNGLGRHLGIHGPVEHALRILRTGRPRLIDTGLAEGHPFFTVAGLGFEADVSDRFNRLARRGFLRYLTTSATTFLNHRSQRCGIEHGGLRTELRVFTLAVANCDQYGNNARIASGASVEDGRLDLVAVPPVTPWNALPLLARLFFGTLDRSRRVVRFRGTRFVVHRAAPGLIHTDGETHSAPARVEFTVRPQSLRVLVPSDARQNF